MLSEIINTKPRIHSRNIDSRLLGVVCPIQIIRPQESVPTD